MPSILLNLLSKIKIMGNTATTDVKIALFWTISLSVEMSFLLKNMAMAIIRVKSIKFPPTMSPNANSGRPWKTAFKSTKKFGREAAKAITKKAMTNSFQFRYLAIWTKDLIRRELSQASKIQESIKIDAIKYHIKLES